MDLLRDATTEWEGVTNPAAVKNLREMKPGAQLIITKAGARKSAVGTATVVSVDASDPKKPKVKIKAGKALAKPVPLEEIKANKLFKDSYSCPRMGRLSVVPLTKEQYAALRAPDRMYWSGGEQPQRMMLPAWLISWIGIRFRTYD